MLPKEMRMLVFERAKGETTEDNLALSCSGCNNHKFIKTEGKDPFTDQLVKLYNPRLHNWNDHFTWADNATIILGISAIGRATVEEYKLNRQRLFNLRRLLFDSGEHPPE